MSHSKEPGKIYKISLASLDLRASLSSQRRAEKLIPKTNIKARIRTLLPKEN